MQDSLHSLFMPEPSTVASSVVLQAAMAPILRNSVWGQAVVAMAAEHRVAVLKCLGQLHDAEHRI